MNLSEQQTDAILKALDEAIENGPWDESNFLRVIGKNLREIRDGFVNQINAPGQEKSRLASNLANRIALRAGQQEIFIALIRLMVIFYSPGSVFSSILPRQMISRPIYANEEDVRLSLKRKKIKITRPMFSLYVSQNDILTLASDKILRIN